MESSDATVARRRRRLLAAGIFGIALVIVIGGAIAWLGAKASTIKTELHASADLVPRLKDDLVHNRKSEAIAAVSQLKQHTSAAREAAGDPIWMLASALPGVGGNFSAATEIARSADDVATLGIDPLVRVYDSLDWDGLLPGPDGTDLAPIQDSARTVASAEHAVRASAERLQAIDASNLLPQISEPLIEARTQLGSVQGTLDAAASASKLAPSMLGSSEQRRYLLLVQNNAEIRATGGIPGALAVLTADKGKLSLASQTSAGALGIFTPAITVDAEQRNIYSTRLGKYVQDINLTPDFPTAAATAKAMWEKRAGEKVDGVISIDPVALGYILDATGPLELADPQVRALGSGMPARLTGDNVVKTLLSDVYSKITEPKKQDAYFAAVASDIFAELSSGNNDAQQLMEGIGRGASEHRILVWSDRQEEQNVLLKYPLSGAVTSESLPPSQFGVYFNDGTGAKMDYYVKRTVQLIQQCPADGYNNVVVRITSTNTAPADAATSLPAYVTGGGSFGVPSGSVQSNVIAYGPSQARIEEAVQDGKKVPFGSQHHGDRPVATVTTMLAPGQSSTVEFLFGKIVQHAAPELVVTPTTEPVKNVVQPTRQETCNSVR